MYKYIIVVDRGSWIVDVDIGEHPSRGLASSASTDEWCLIVPKGMQIRHRTLEPPAPAPAPAPARARRVPDRKQTADLHAAVTCMHNPDQLLRIPERCGLEWLTLTRSGRAACAGGRSTNCPFNCFLARPCLHLAVYEICPSVLPLQSLMLALRVRRVVVSTPS